MSSSPESNSPVNAERITRSENEDAPTSSRNSNTQRVLTQEQLQRMEKNRKRALEIRKSKETGIKIAKLVVQSSEQKKLLDTGAGFYLDEEDLIEEQIKEANVVQDPPVPIPDEHLICDKCCTRFPHSFLYLKFGIDVCDSCRIKYSEDYKLITKTDAKAEFLLKDCDFDFREPPLKFIVKKNPHKTRNDMKLFLYIQCKQRAMEVHESEDNLEDKKELREHNLHKTRQRNYEKKLQVLRKEARSASKKVTEFHKHEYGEEEHDEDEDIYFKICKTCSHRLEYEQL